MPRPPEDELGTPTICFIIADQLLVFDRVAQTLTIIVNGIIGPGDSPAEVYEAATNEVARIVAMLEQPSEYKPVSFPDELPEKEFQSNQAKDRFLKNVGKADRKSTRLNSSHVVNSYAGFCLKKKNYLGTE